MNSTGALKLQTVFFNQKTGEWISQFTGGNEPLSNVVLTSSDSIKVFVDDLPGGICTLSSVGVLTNSFDLTPSGTVTRVYTTSKIIIDSSDNIYLAFVIKPTALSSNYAEIMKFNSSGILQWQQYFNKTNTSSSTDGMITSLAITPGNDLLVGVSNDTGGATNSVVSVNSNTGAIITSRSMLTGTSSPYTTPTIVVDSVNSELLIGGWNTSVGINIGRYAYNNSGPNLGTLRIYDPASTYKLVGFTTDGTYIYLTYKTGGGIGIDKITKIDKNTGNIIFGISLSIITLGSPTIDDAGNIYLTGVDLSLGYIIKINGTTGNVMWAKSISPSFATNNIIWKSGFIYFIGNSESVFKLKDNGSTPNGTYGPFTINSVSLSSVVDLPANVVTVTPTITSTTKTITTTSFTRSTSTASVTTYYI